MRDKKHFLALLLVALLFISCDKEYNTIGAGLVNEDHFQLKEDFDSKLTTTPIIFDDSHPVQTDNLSYNTLGHYNHPVYGETTANIVSQVALSEYGKDFGDNPVITKVIVSIPYFSKKISVEEDGTGIYELDSVYGDAKINLKMFRSDYFLNDFDENDEAQQYYSNTILPGIEHTLLYENTDFKPLPSEVSYEKLDSEGEVETIRLSPRLRDDSSYINDADVNETNILDVANFNWLIDPINTTAISSASNFKDFYRGIYFKATSITADGSLLGLNLGQAEIEIFHGKLLFEEDGSTPLDDDNDGDQDIEDVGTVKMLFSGKRVNTFDNIFPYPSVFGSTYLNGGQGAMMAIDLFTGVDTDNNGISDKFEALKNGDILINEASLEFHVDQSVIMGDENEPDRIFLYDMKNNKTLLDYQFDTTSDSDTNLTQLNHLGKLERDASGNGIKYKIRITEHITDLIRNDSTNVKLGLVVTNNVLALGTSKVKDFETISGGLPESVFSSSVNSHKGTVLYNENAIDDDKRLKLKIYYTEADTDGIDNN